MKAYRYKFFTEESFIVLYLLFVFLVVKHFFQYQLGGYDLSPLIDICYRLENGETPGIDFISTFPLSILFWIKLNLLFLKNDWNFLFYSGFIHFVICFGFIYCTIKKSKAITSGHTLLVLIILSLPVLVTNHIWPSYFSLYNVAVLYTSLTVIILSERIRKIDYVVFFLFGGLSFFSKQNIGLLCSMLFFATIGFFYLKRFLPKQQIVILALLCLISVVFYGLLFSLSLGADLNTFIKTYTSVAGRGVPTKDQIREVFISNKENLLLVCVSIIGSSIIFLSLLKASKERCLKNFDILIWFNVCVQVIGYYCVLTNWDTKFNDVSIIALSDLLLLYVFNRQFQFKVFSIVIVLISFWGGYLGYSRYRMEKVGYGAYFEKGKLYQIKNGYLTGLYCGSKLFSINNELLSLRKKHFLTNKTFFGPRLEFSYAQYDIPSPRHFPLWWHPGSSYGPKDENYVIGNFKKKNFDVLIFLKGDRTRMPGEILNYISKNYTPSVNSYNLDIYSIKVREARLN